MNATSRRLPASLDRLPEAQSFVVREAERAGLDRRSMGRLELAFEEVFVNVCHYASPAGSSGGIEVRTSTDAGRFVVDVLDDGRPFDPQTLATPDLTLPLEARAVGGLGWFLTRQMVTELHCGSEQGRNLVSLIMRLPGDAA